MKLEVFEDRMYWDQFAIRPEGSKSFHDTIHFVRKVDALVAMRVIESWIEQEREACAQLVEQAGIDGYGTLAAAAAIRTRGNQ